MDFLRMWGIGSTQAGKEQEPQLDLTALRRQLNYLDESNLKELVTFKQELENKLTSYPDWLGINTPSRIVPAHQLTRDEVFTHFDLKDTINDKGERVMYDWVIPEVSGSCSEWLSQGLNLSVDIFRAKTANITAIINLVILDVIHDLPEFKVLDHFKPGDAAPERPPQVIVSTPGQPFVIPPKRLKIRAYKQHAIFGLLGTGKDLIRITGCFDAAFSCGYMLSARKTCNVVFITNHLIVLQVKRTHMMLGNQNVHNSTNELCAYLAMIQRGQVEYLDAQRNHFGTGAGFGVVSDGEWCRFIQVDSEKMVRFGDVLMIKYDYHKIIQYIRHIFTAIVADYKPRN